MFSKLFLIIATILYYVYANPVSEPSKKSLDYTKMSCLVRQITHPQEFEEQQLINPLPAAMNLIYLFISLIQNWNKECWKKIKKFVYKSWTKYLLLSRWFNEKNMKVFCVRFRLLNQRERKKFLLHFDVFH